MHWKDLFNPDKVIAAAFKVFLALLAVMFVMQLLVAALSRASAKDIVLVLFCWAVVSVVAFYIRERRRGQKQQPRRVHGAERTPLMPTRKGE
ncbi:MAG: hypothetical protein L0338_19265 [Acidobacteria bacterium]|nr:hypothetical protein [Acidobacteriota bacterium]